MSERESFDVNNLRTGFLIGVTPSSELYWTPVGNEKASPFELLGLIMLAKDIITYTCTAGMPSYRHDFALMNKKLDEITNSIRYSCEQDEKRLESPCSSL